ncbi:MAG: glycosyltransferase family 2 protein [Dethiobacter sp.]|nr:glycosyltransferase family 2 protein [Dethiobacter sp.]
MINSMNLPVRKLTISIVSHGQSHLISNLLHDLAKLRGESFEVILTINIPENELLYQDFKFPLRIIRNNYPKGFGENHNVAFEQSTADYFSVVNPDIRIASLNIAALTEPFKSGNVGAVAPLVLSPEGKIEDSARQFPTIPKLLKRILLGIRKSEYELKSEPLQVDWVAGMFIVFDRRVFQAVGGFDSDRFFMYYEDVDICRRIGIKGWKVIVNPSVSVVHLAQRASRKNLRHMRWHIVSAFRFLTGL